MDVSQGKASLISLKDCQVPDQVMALSGRARDTSALGLGLGIPLQAGPFEAESSLPSPSPQPLDAAE